MGGPLSEPDVVEAPHDDALDFTAVEAPPEVPTDVPAALVLQAEREAWE